MPDPGQVEPVGRRRFRDGPRWREWRLQSPAVATDWRLSDSLELVVAFALELKQAEAVSKGVVQQGESTVGVLTGRGL